MSLVRIAGILLAVTGAAHLAAPKPWELVTKPLFPDDTAAWVKRNGITELALGTAVAVPKTRKLGLAGVAGYTAWLGSRALKAVRT